MPQQWKCPFCPTTSTRPQGLSAHIRYGHTKQFAKWLKNPDRLEQARKAGGVDAVVEEEPVDVAEPVPEPVEAVHATPSVSENPTEQLLMQAQSQLIARKSVVEAELARLDDLREEIKTIDKQLESLNSTLAIFRPQPSDEKAGELASAAGSSAV